MFKIKTPTLRIHCWGGLGSQLQALSFYLMVQSKYPNRNLQLILHTSGITERRSEIDFVSDRINLVSIHDFKSKVENTNVNFLFRFNFRSIFKNLARNILNIFRFVITKENRVMAIMPWTTQVRCSYSNIELSSDLIKNLGEIVQFPVEKIDNNFIGVHLRVGDLAALKPESLVNSETIGRLINNLDEQEKTINKVIIYSDSELNFDNFDSLKGFMIELRNMNTFNTIFDLTNPRIFIGTNSKVSLWVAIFRYGYKIPGIILLPTSIFESFNKIITPIQQIDDFRMLSYTA